ncbi:MAG: hypothetical protein Q4B86_02200 [Eubacteriales bacterium]|nr:hypothetical protein [Eubacteriales bacterium]
MGKNKKKIKNNVAMSQAANLTGEYGLPIEYLERMEEFFGDEYPDFLNEYSKKPLKGLRFNMKKARKETIEKLTGLWGLEQIPWCDTGYYYEEDKEIIYPDGHTDKLRPGKTPYHAAGVFYIQEPSAMITVSKADIKDNEIVLDLCAAPGGKSSQAAERAGILVSNEIIPKRARILSSNIERLGFENVIVTQASPEELSDSLPEFFDKIIVDAPCSGEGMMRRDETAVKEWSLNNVNTCVLRQREILAFADKMLKPGGKLIYSTCTFEPYENKWQIRSFVNSHPEYELIEQEHIYPHRQKGEGHYCAVLEKKGQTQGIVSKENVKEQIEYITKRLKSSGVHVLRSGLEKGELIIGKYNGELRYEPSHAEVMAKSYNESENAINLTDENKALSYLRGESLRLNKEESGTTFEEKGEEAYVSVCYDGYSLGLGKRSKDQIKNHYPKGLRFF